MADNRVIVALDFHELSSVQKLVAQLGDSITYYKVGMELFYSVGSSVIEYLRMQKKDIFLDLKLHDIPNTTAQGLVSLTRLGVSMLNIHATGGYTMMKTAADNLKEQAIKLNMPCPKLIAVTVLTSIDENDWQGLGMTMPIREQVVRLAQLAQKAGMDGVVASPLEAAAIREAVGDDFMIVTPGIRPSGTAANDQRRITTPRGALKSGASHLVIGRPITAAANPKTAAEQILAEIKEVEK